MGKVGRTLELDKMNMNVNEILAHNVLKKRKIF